MVDIEKPSQEPEEYQFKTEEYGIKHEPEPMETTEHEPIIGQPSRIKLPISKKLLWVIGIIVFFFIAYQIISPKKPSSEALSPSKTPDAQAAVVSGQVSQLNQKISGNGAKIKALEDKLSNTQSAISNLQATVDNLNTTVQGLSQSVQQLALAQKTAQVRMKARIPKAPYHVRAIVSGRAWLEARDGRLITVRPGTKLSSYGKVTEINSRQGIVKTDLGVIIKYGINDI